LGWLVQEAGNGLSLRDNVDVHEVQGIGSGLTKAEQHQPNAALLEPNRGKDERVESTRIDGGDFFKFTITLWRVRSRRNRSR
jgi:hypothetical protein